MDVVTTRPAEPDERFRALYAEHGRAVLAYAIRRVGEPEDAADVVAETFLVAWRRRLEIPAGDDAKLWLYGVARRVLANQQRAERRRQRLAERLHHELPAAVAAVSAPASTRDFGLYAALRRLTDDDREILLLASWEQLRPVEIARVLGIGRVTARSRLRRARARLRTELNVEAGAAGSISTTRLEEAR